ncbi:excisionase family DNA-binding protein [Novosphingobium sp. ES2-1]|nr:excisionase family DNA-binding protein [Novosphingobium sp. ES2-1]
MASQPETEARPFSVPQLAERWGCSEGLIRKMIRDGRLQCFRPGALIRISATEVERYECQVSQQNSPSSVSERVSRSSGEKTASAAVDNSHRSIGRAPRRKRESSGKGQTVLRGPWGGA